MLIEQLTEQGRSRSRQSRHSDEFRSSHGFVTPICSALALPASLISPMLIPLENHQQASCLPHATPHALIEVIKSYIRITDPLPVSDGDLQRNGSRLS
jgi:hypothetical protein